MIPLRAALVQTAVEYGAMAGQTGANGSRSGSADILWQARELVTDNPVALVSIVLTIVVLAAFLRTRSYRS